MRFMLRFFACALFATVLATAGLPEDRKAAEKLMEDGNFKEALAAFAKLTTRPRPDAPDLVVEDLYDGLTCIRQLGQEQAFEVFVENAVRAQRDNWRLLAAAADGYRRADHYGATVGGEFQRGQGWGGGERANVRDRDRVRALQLMRDAEKLARKEEAQGALHQFYRDCAELYVRHGGQSWRMQTLTDLDGLPEMENGYHGDGGARNGAPVDAAGKPVLYPVPKSLEEAVNDGERWRWFLARSEQVSPEWASSARLDFAQFLYWQFGVQTVAGLLPDSQGRAPALDPRTLAKDETICQLATGIQRLHLPDEFSYVRIFETLADSPISDTRRTAVETLATVFESRRQYEMAVTWWERLAALGAKERERAQPSIEQIVGCWGEFEEHRSRPAGRPATVGFRFRNGKSVRFTAQRIDVERVLADIVAYAKSKPARLNTNRLQLSDLGQRVIDENRAKYLGEQVAEWSLDLDPPPHHLDRRITVTTPLREGGVYLLTATMADGNTSRTIVRLDDLVVARKQLDGKVFYYVADSVTGAPVPAKLDFLGCRQDRIDQTDRYRTLVREFAATTSADGQLTLGSNQLPDEYEWLVTARAGNRLAWHELDGLYRLFAMCGSGKRQDPVYNRIMAFVMTDRPVYRPEHTVRWKAWVRRAQYDMEDTSQFAGKTFWVEIRDGKWDRLYGETQVADEYGGINGELTLGKVTGLGVYGIIVKRADWNGDQVGSGSFRVEEYKKPEFEVKVEAPTEPIMLGEKVEAKVTATYYLGAPVTEATVKVKVTRLAYDANWYPVRLWDWFYGNGYGWFGHDYDWYPGWSRWGRSRPVFSWDYCPSFPSELVSENELEIGPDGTVTVPIDTALAKLMHGDLDHRYEITAEVRDQSRRTIVGSGQVLVAREPFKVHAWTDRGYYQVGDTVEASFQSRRLDGQPVVGTGKLRLLKVAYAVNREPRETEVQSWELPCNERGFATQQLKASLPGQYRLSYTVTDTKGHEIEGGYLFVVRGEGFDGEDYRFGALELVPDRAEYHPGETVQLMVNTDRPDSTVLLFVRPVDRVYLPPRVLRLQGKSTVVAIPVTKRDMPNFFVEALTIADGELHTDVREIIVPPEKRVLTVDVTPNQQRYRPGEKGTARIRLADEKGKPFVGSVVVTVYDKSVEYVAGGSSIADIRSFFWKWRRNHYESTASSLEIWFANLLTKEEQSMAVLGLPRAFGVTDGRCVDGGYAPRGMEVMDQYTVGVGTPPLPPPAVTVRTNFADTALWIASRQTDADGTTTIDLPMPESLTTWKIRVWAMGHGTKVGEGSAEIITSKDLIVRLQAPRFLVETDEVVLSANIHSYVDRKRKVTAILELDGPCLKGRSRAKRRITLKPNGERRVDWRVKAMAEGEAVVRMKAIAADDADAMEMRFPVFVHGMEKMDSYCGVVHPGQQAGGTTLHIPKERRPETARLEVRYSPTLAMAMTDALPYLISYPHGCTEQTLNRFLPAVLTQKTLQRLGVSLAEIRKKRANLNAQEIGDPAERAKQWKRYKDTPAVWDEAEMAKIIKDGVEALSAMRLSDGGWGWFSGYGEHSWPHTTAQVVHGLQVAAQNDVAVKKDVIERGVAWLKRYEAKQVQRLKNGEKDPKVHPWKSHADHMDAMIYMVLAEHDHLNAAMRDYLYRDRNHLSLYAKGMFGLALHQQKQVTKRDMIIRNIRQYLKTDDENQTAYLDMANGSYWWYGDEIETHAIFLRLLAATEPKGDTAHRLVKYLLNNRKHATYWKSTRDTAACVEAFADYIKASGEDKPDQIIQVVLDGKVVKEVKVKGDNLFSFDNTFVLSGKDLGGGDHKLELRKQGTGPLYWNAYASYFTLQEFIPKTGLEVKVERRVYRLKPVAKEIDVAGSRNQALRQKVDKVERVPVKSGDTVTSGDLIEIELLVESKNDYEYILIEDMKAAGMEPVDVRSGYTGNGLGAYVEFRDEKVAFFVRRLMRGKHSVSYRLRAEIPGSFSALPTRISAMYAPELRGNSDEIKVRIKDK